MRQRRRSSPTNRRGGALAAVVAGLALVLPACEEGGHFTVAGYTTKPNYDLCIHTVHVPIFQNKTLWRGIEFDLTRAVIREIEEKTPYKVVSDPCAADSVLTGTIISLNKNILNRDQLNEVREAETTLAVEVVWKNRAGEVLSQPAPRGVAPVTPSLPATDGPSPLPVPLGPPPPDATPPAPPPAPPVLVQSIGGFIPELGQSLTTAQKQNVDRMAVQIVSMMEKPW